jgi:DNA-binding transcriptional regulator/RsmH inhibitor MraZ
MVQASAEVLPEKGRLFLPVSCFRQLLGGPDAVSILAIEADHFEIWDQSDLDEYLRPRAVLNPAKPGQKP